MQYNQSWATKKTILKRKKSGRMKEMNKDNAVAEEKMRKTFFFWE